MTTDEIIDIIDAHLQEVNSNRDERLSRINEILGFVSYNKRLTELTDAEQKDFVCCNEGYPFTSKQQNILDKNPHKKDYYLNMWARATYFRQCAWLGYLFGETDKKPSLTKQ